MFWTSLSSSDSDCPSSSVSSDSSVSESCRWHVDVLSMFSAAKDASLLVLETLGLVSSAAGFGFDWLISEVGW